MNYKTVLGFGLTTLLVLGAGCASTTTTDTNTTTTLEVPVDLTNEVNETVVVDEDDVDEVDTDEEEDSVSTPTTQTFDVVAQQFEFSPASITVNQGDTVVLNLTTADVPHGFSLPQFDVNETITPGKTKTVEFVADTAGTFSFACSVVCGAGHSGMTGTLVVN